MENLTAYCLPLRRRCEIEGPSLIVLKNGRKAVTGRAKDAPQYKVFRILSDSEANELREVLN